MTFKNSKEEVLELQLTSYGKHLLSIGKLNPKFYSFFDDDILYDSQYSGDLTSTQNEEEPRILEQTPRLRNQVYMFGVETEVERQIEQARSGNKAVENYFSTIDNDYTLSIPLARSSLSSDFAPAWDITFYGAEVETFNAWKESPNHRPISIAQVNMANSMFVTRITSSAPNIRMYSEIDATITTYNNGNTIDLDSSEFIIEVDEEHTIPLSKNYDIEVYVIRERQDPISGQVEQFEERLSFVKEPKDYEIIEDILYKREPEALNLEIDNTYVEYFLDIKFDTEIDKQLLCELGYRTDYAKRGYIPVDCTERTTDQDSVYDSDIPLPPFGDDC